VSTVVPPDRRMARDLLEHTKITRRYDPPTSSTCFKHCLRPRGALLYPLFSRRIGGGSLGLIG